jgi:DNA-binding LytR/AlgR family response regulator
MNPNTLIHLGAYEKVPPSTILMLKADSNYTTIYLQDGKQIMSSTCIGTLEKRLSAYQFFRLNRSTLVSLSYISKFGDKNKVGDSSVIVLKNDEEIKISRRKVKDINNKFHQNTEVEF